MACGTDDKLVLIGAGWFWLSDVIGIVPPDHVALLGVTPDMQVPKGNSIVALESLSCLVGDERTPEQLTEEIMA